MPIHDWTRVLAGTFHHFHSAWITHLAEPLNGGILPGGYYALAEQHAGLLIPDILTFRHTDTAVGEAPPGGGAVAVAEAPPRVSRRLVATPEAVYRRLRRTLAIRAARGHHLVAILEIVSPANKDRPASVEALTEKIASALRCGCHVLLVDLLPPGRHDPQGIHGPVWEGYGSLADDPATDDKPYTLASYVAEPFTEAFVEPLGLGDDLPEMPLFLQADSYVNVPLESTYRAAHRGLPSYVREILDGQREPERG